MPKNIYKAVAYLRISTSDEKEGESESLTNQRSIIKDFVDKNHDIILVSEKIDDGLSGLSFTRPSFLEMIDDIKKQTVNCVIVKDMSRFGREFCQTGDYLRNQLPKYGVRFIAISDNIDTLVKDIGDIDVTIKVILNDEYCKDISIKTRSSLKAKRDKGEFHGTLPYGYTKENNQLLIDPFPASIVQEIFDLTIDGYSAYRIADILNEKKVLSPHDYKRASSNNSSSTDYRWSAQTVIRILKSEIYIGTITLGKLTTISYKLKKTTQRPKEDWSVFENAVDPIVSLNDFLLVQKLRKLDIRTSPKTEQLPLFSGLLICSQCGNSLVKTTTSVNSKSDGEIVYSYYRCKTSRKNGCYTKAIKEDVLVEIISTHLSFFITNVLDLEKALSSFDVEKKNSFLEKKCKNNLKKISVKKEDIQHYLSSLKENYANGIIEKCDFLQFKQEYQRELAELESAIQHVKDDYKQSCIDLEGKVKWIEDIKSYEFSLPLTRRNLVRFVEFIKIGEEIEIIYRFRDEFLSTSELLEGMEEDGT